MSLTLMLAQTADMTMQGMAHVGPHLHSATHALMPVIPAVDPGIAGHPALHSHGIILADAQSAVSDYAARVKQFKPTEEHLGWLTAAGKYFIGIFQKGGEVFSGFVTGIIPTLVVLMTAFYAIIEFVGEKRMHGFAQAAGKYYLTRYTILPIIAMFFLTNPRAYTFGTFLEEKHKPAYYDSAVSFCHPILGLFPHANPGEYFVWGGVLVALLELEQKGTVPANYHITVAIWYFIVGVVVILLKGMMTERITAIMARREGVEL
jgi:PTS system glucitol/sorbitol-specific IIC component